MELALVVQPLLLLPGVALLIQSTQTRFGQLHSELHRLLEHAMDRSDPARLLRRGRLLRDALMCLYGAVVLLCASAFVAAVGCAVTWNGAWPVVWGVGGAVVLVLVAAVQLVRESRLLVVILDHHRRELEEGGDGT